MGGVKKLKSRAFLDCDLMTGGFLIGDSSSAQHAVTLFIAQGVEYDTFHFGKLKLVTTLTIDTLACQQDKYILMHIGFYLSRVPTFGFAIAP